MRDPPAWHGQTATNKSNLKKFRRGLVYVNQSIPERKLNKIR